jgi:Flp pilus assembly protein TadD
MRVSLRAFVVLACACWLAGCETTGLKLPWASDSQSSSETTQGTADLAAQAETVPADPTVITGSTPASTGLSGERPGSDLQLGKRYYRENQFGLAEQHFRRAVEKGPKDLEAWVGLAAAYDKLRRFDLADRAYNQAVALAGPTPEILNNHGYSYLLRGDRRRAREKLLAAQARDPNNPYIKNNLDLLDESFARRKDVQ